MKVELRETPFDPLRELEQYQAAVNERLRGQCGAAAIFIGTMRDFNDGKPVYGMTLEHYPGMTERHLQRIVETAGRESPLLDTLVIHRVGDLQPNDPIVLVAVASSHRGEAFAACEFIMDYLKTRAPFWKKEETADGERWVEARASDDAAAARWDPS